MKRIQPVILLLAAMTLYFTDRVTDNLLQKVLHVPKQHACWHGPYVT